jgi:hypothetical protein
MITEVIHQEIPDLAADQRDLSAAALVGVADNAASGSKRGARDSVHRAAVSALYPDCLDSTSCHRFGEQATLCFAEPMYANPQP